MLIDPAGLRDGDDVNLSPQDIDNKTTLTLRVDQFRSKLLYWPVKISLAGL